jgi:hypothetical protein
LRNGAILRRFPPAELHQATGAPPYRRQCKTSPKPPSPAADACLSLRKDIALGSASAILGGFQYATGLFFRDCGLLRAHRMPFSGERTTCEPSFAHPTMQSPQKSLAPDEPKYLLARARG